MFPKRFFLLAKGANALERILSAFGALLILTLTILVSLDVFFRFLLNHSIAGLYELSELMLVGMVYLSIAYVQTQKGHVIIDIIYARIPGKPRKVLMIFNLFLCIAVVMIITIRSGYLAWQAWKTQDYSSGIIQWPLWPAKMAIPFGCGLLTIRLIRDLLEIVIPCSDK